MPSYEDDNIVNQTSEFELCLYPDNCCMPGPHLPFECHTAEMAEELMREALGV
jgi:hypothetical protein